MKEVAPNFRVSAIAPDGVIEAIEAKGDRFVLGVQFHPEWLIEGDADMRRLFEMFVASAAGSREASH